jgi:toxin-antitoxin system PIN domain toxin
MTLFDTNLLNALGDRPHQHHEAAVKFLRKTQADGWATCPLTENAFLRIVGHPNYSKGPGDPNIARIILQGLTAQPGHEFWPDSISLPDLHAFPEIPSSKHLTDYYLLALAIENGASLATFDRRTDPVLINGGLQAHLVIQP